MAIVFNSGMGYNGVKERNHMKELYKALDEFHKSCPLVKATKENPFFKSKYADYNIIVSETRPHLVTAGLRVKQTLTHINEVTAIRTRLIHLESDQVLEDVSPVAHKPNDPQAQGSGITYAKRYAYVAMLDLLVDVDDDGNLSNKLSDASQRKEKVEAAIDSFKNANSLESLKKAFVATGKLMSDPRVITAKDARKEELGE